MVNKIRINILNKFELESDIVIVIICVFIEDRDVDAAMLIATLVNVLYLIIGGIGFQRHLIELVLLLTILIPIYRLPCCVSFIQKSSLTLIIVLVLL